MTKAGRLDVGLLAVMLFVLSSALVLAPVRTADVGMTLAYVPHGGATRIVQNVESGGPAAHAGLKDGDVVDLGRMRLNDRLALYWQTSPADVTIPIQRGLRHFVVRLPIRSPLARLPFWAIVITIAANAIYFALVFLVLRDASQRHEGRILLGWLLAQLANNDYYLVFAPTGILAFIGAAMTPITGGILYYYIARFVLAVPARASPLSAFFGKLIPFIIGLYVICDVLIPAAANLLPALDFGNGASSEPMRLLWYGDLLALALIVAIIIDGIVHTSPPQRVQLLCVASTVFVIIAIEATRAVFYLTIGSAPTVIDTVAYPLESVSVLGASYAVLRYNLIDLQLIISRAAIFALVSAILVGAFIVAEWGASKVAEKILGSVPLSAIEQYAGLFAALIAGLLARYVHAFVERSLNRIVFRGQYRNEDALMRFAREADTAGDARALLAGAFDTLRTHVPASYVALIVRDGDAYRIAHASRIFDRTTLSDSSQVLNRRDFSQPFQVDDPTDQLFRATIFPTTVLGRLVTCVVCGPKIDRTKYGDREISIISDFSHRVGTAYALLCGSRALNISRARRERGKRLSRPSV